MTVAELRKTESTPVPKATNIARGLEGIVANTTRLSDVIGDKGQLIYAGYDINDLAGKVSYKEVVYLLWKGKLPNRRELDEFTHALRAEPQAKEASDALDVAFVLHADHGMNASTFSARVTISTLSDFYSAITSAIGTLKGPLHGGANEGVIQMLQEIGEEKNVDAYIEK